MAAVRLDLSADEAEALLMTLQTALENSCHGPLDDLSDWRVEQFRLSAQAFNKLAALYDEHHDDLPKMLVDADGRTVRFWPTDLREIAASRRES